VPGLEAGRNKFSRIFFDCVFDLPLLRNTPKHVIKSSKTIELKNERRRGKKMETEKSHILFTSHIFLLKKKIFWAPLL
jgi:hypothetical protein